MTRRLLLLLAIGLGACESDGRSLAQPVEVLRDEWGVPHIYASRVEDALLVLGYETARDRLFQLDFNRRRALGTSAELFGEAALPDDRIARTLGFGALGEAGVRDLEANDPRLAALLEAYAAGISAYIDDAARGAHGAVQPPEYAMIDPAYRPEPWRASDVIALLKAQLFLLAAHPESDLLGYALASTAGTPIYLDIYRPDPIERIYVTDGFPSGDVPLAGHRNVGPDIGPGVAHDERMGRAALALADALSHFSRRRRIGPVAASNNWALCGRATADGVPLLANDPHLDIDLPTNFYELDLQVDDPETPLHVAGYGFPGTPAVALGHNLTAAWGVTTVEADVADSFLETLDASGTHVMRGGAAVPLQVHEELLRVRNAGGPVSDFRTETLRVRVVPDHGPILSDAVPDVAPLLDSTQAISMQWVGFGVTGEARAFDELMRAGSYADFREALTHFEAGLFNFIYAGTDGDLGYFPHSKYPIRAHLDPQAPPYGVMPADGAHEWTGQFIPDAHIPQLHDPASCRVFTANNDPVGTTADGDVLNDAYYLGGTFDYGFRARRIRDRLDALPAAGATPAAMEAMQGDVHSALADRLLPPLLDAAAAQPPSAAAAELIAILSAWNREDEIGQVGPTIFAAYYSQLIHDVFADDMPVTFAQLGTDDRNFAALLLHVVRGEPVVSGHDYLGGATPSATMLAALETVASTVPAALGADPAQWIWGQTHTVTLDHPLGGSFSLGPFPAPGGIASLFVGKYAAEVAGQPVIKTDVIEAPNARIVVQLTPGAVRMRSVLPSGESGVPGSAHYADQNELWRGATLHDSRFDPQDVAAHAGAPISYPAGFPYQR